MKWKLVQRFKDWCNMGELLWPGLADFNWFLSQSRKHKKWIQGENCVKTSYSMYHYGPDFHNLKQKVTGICPQASASVGGRDIAQKGGATLLSDRSDLRAPEVNAQISYLTFTL